MENNKDRTIQNQQNKNMPEDATPPRLTAWLCEKYGLGSIDVIRHFDVQGKECPRYFVVNEDTWELFKADVEAAIGLSG